MLAQQHLLEGTRCHETVSTAKAKSNECFLNAEYDAQIRISVLNDAADSKECFLSLGVV